MEGDGDAGEGNVGMQASVEGGTLRVEATRTLTQGVKVAVGGSEGEERKLSDEGGSELGDPVNVTTG